MYGYRPIVHIGNIVESLGFSLLRLHWKFWSCSKHWLSISAKQETHQYLISNQGRVQKLMWCVTMVSVKVQVKVKVSACAA